jgi:hypothetical protein
MPYLLFSRAHLAYERTLQRELRRIQSVTSWVRIDTSSIPASSPVKNKQGLNLKMKNQIPSPPKRGKIK